MKVVFALVFVACFVCNANTQDLQSQMAMKMIQQFFGNFGDKQPSLTPENIFNVINHFSGNKFDPEKVSPMMFQLLSTLKNPSASMTMPTPAAQNNCQLQTKISEKRLMKLRAGDFSSKNPSVKAYVFCIYGSLRLVDTDGKIDKDLAAMMAPKDLDRERFDKAIDECQERNEMTPIDRTYALLKCYNAKYPKTITVL